MNFGDFLIYFSTFIGIYTTIYFLLTLFEYKSNIRRGLTNVYPTVSIIVPCYNEEDTIIKTLKSLLDLDYDWSKLKIFVIDDGSTDRTFSLVENYISTLNNDSVKLFHKKNGGKYTALNFALEKIDSEYFGALDADSFVDKFALRRIIPFFKSKEVMAVTPSMKIYKPTTFLQRIQSIEYLLGVFLRKVFAELGSIHVTPGPFSIYRREFILKYGVYKKAYHTEDIEMALRIQKNNYVIENTVDAYVYTMGPSNFNVLLKQRLRWYLGFLKNVVAYKSLFSRGHGNLGLFILPSSFVSVALVVVFLIYFVLLKLSNLFQQFLNLWAVNFDIFALKWFNFDWFFINTSAVAFFGIISFLLSVTVIYIAKKISEEDSSITFSYILFISCYWALFAFWWILSIFRMFSSKDYGWGHKSDR